MTEGVRAPQWIALLRQLSQRCNNLAADGDLDEGFAGLGDIDLIAPFSDWPVVEAEFKAWALDWGLGPVVACRHRAGALLLLALGGEGPTFWELEVRGCRYFRGGMLFSADDLLPLMREDPRGFRRIALGAGGLIKLLPNGLAWGGRLKWRTEKADRVFTRLRDDPEGVSAALTLYGSAAGAVTHLAEAAARGGWNRRAALVIEGWALLRALRHPIILLSRGVSRLKPRPCLVQRAVASGRQRPTDPGSWLASVARDHDVDALRR